MRLPTPDDAELTAAVRRYVTPGRGGLPRYLKLLGGNFLLLDEGKRRRFLKHLATDARQVSDRELGTLLESEWRGRLTAAWLIGLDRREQFRDELGELLLASDLTYAGQGYCFALARFATPADASILASYLDTYLPQLDKRYDQVWALGALLHVDAELGTDQATRFLAEGGLWQEWRRTETTAAELHAWMDRLCFVASEYTDTT